MKKCKSCGALQKDERTVCIDCGQRLGKSLTEDELRALEEGIEIQLEEMIEDSDEFHVSRFEHVLIALHAILSVALIVVCFINPLDLENIGESLFYGLVMNVIATVELLFPSAMWALHVGMLSFRYANADELEPGWGWKIGRKAVSFIVLGLTAFLVYAIWFIG